MWNLGIVTISDKGAMGLREDQSGEEVVTWANAQGVPIRHRTVVPDDKGRIAETLIEMVDMLHCDVVITTGGTGLGPRDVTPEATLYVIDRIVPGIAEAMRHESLKKTRMAMLSRGIAGVRRKTLIINLPGSPKAVRECLEIIQDVIGHAVDILTADEYEHR